MRRPSLTRLTAALCLVVGLTGAASVVTTTPARAAAPSSAAVGDDVIAWVEVEDGVISGGAAGPPGLNSGDHSNFSGTGSYTFRETGMASTMSVTAPEAGTYPVYVRYAAGPLGADENVTRSMGLLTNGGARQQMSLPMTSFENWEAWRFVEYDVTLQQGANTVAIQCDRSIDFCRLNFDAIQVGGTAPDPCPGTPVTDGWNRLFDGTFDSFDGWRKAGAGGFGRQTDCSIQSFRGRGAEWFTQQQTAPYTLRLDWRRNDANDDSSVYVGSSSRGGADPVGGFAIPIGADTGAIVPTGGTAQPADRAAVTGALRPVGQWNTYTIEVTGTQVRVRLNGTVVNTFTNPTAIPAGGFVGLENRGFLDSVGFRDIQLRSGVAPQTRTIQVLGTNDFHGHLLADDEGSAGAAMLAGAVKALRADNPDTVFAAAGDLLGGSPFESSVQQDSPTVDALDEAGLDVSAVGTHELDRGLDDLVGRVQDRADWEYVAANLRRRADGTQPLAASWTKAFGEVEVGFVGATTQSLPSQVDPAGIADVEVTDVVAEVNAEADELEAEGVDVIVLLVHEGAATTSLASATDGSAFGRIVRGVDANVDAIISGRTHLTYDHAVPVQAWIDEGRAVTTRPVVSAGRYGANLNRLTFTVDTTSGDVTAATQEVLPLVTSPAHPADADTQAIVDAAVTRADVLGAETLATLAGPVQRARRADGTTVNLGGESTLGNVVAESQRRATGTQLALVSPTSLRSDLLGATYPADLTLRQAARVQPSADALVTLRLTGLQLRTVLEQQWQRTSGGSVPADPFLRLGTSAGFAYTYDPTRALGSRVTAMRLDGAAVVPTTSYSVTVDEDLAAGGDNVRALRSASDVQATGDDDLSALLDHLGAVDGPVAADPTQHSVGVTFPGGPASSYVAGGSFAVDLTSLAFSGPSDPRDDSVLVSLGGRSLGSFPVDAAVGSEPDDEAGRAAVRATVPADTVAGPATVRIVGATTGTVVELPITVTAPVRASSATAVSAPSAISVTRGVATLRVSVASSGGTPTGEVEIWVDGARHSTVALRDGRATATVGPFATAGTRRVQVRYLGSSTTAASASAVSSVQVRKVTPGLSVRVHPTPVVAGRTWARLTVAVRATGSTPTGTVAVRVGRRSYTGTLRNGAVTVAIGRFARAGTAQAVVTYRGDARTAARSVTATIRVARP